MSDDQQQTEYDHNKEFAKYSSLDPVSQSMMALSSFQIIEGQKAQLKEKDEIIEKLKNQIR